MLEQFMQLIERHGRESVVNNTAVPNEHNNGIMEEARNIITSTLQGMAQNGQGDQVAQMAQDSNHPAAQQLQSNFSSSIIEKFGLDGNAASNIAASLIPGVLAAMTGNNSGNSGGMDGFNLSSLLQSFTGGQNSKNAISAIGGKLGLDKDGDGDVDIKDVTKMFGM